MKIFLDSSVFIESIKGNKDTLKMLKMLLSADHELFINMNVVEETYYILKKANYAVEEIIGLFDDFEIIPLDERTYEVFNELFITNEKIKTVNDLLHYASCQVNNIDVIVTLDKDYLKIKSNTKIKIVNSLQELKAII